MNRFKSKKLLLTLLLIVIISIPAIIPFFSKGFFVTDDGEWMIIRFSAFHQALTGGQFPVRLLPRLNFEYGYPVANFLYPGFMYLGEFIHVLKFGYVDTVKMIFVLSLLGSSIFSFLWLSRIFPKLESFVGSVVYLYAPYHLYDVYKRGSIGEVLALAVVPFILWSIEKKNYLFLSLGVLLLVLSHNTLAFLFILLIGFYILLRAHGNKKELFSFFLSLSFGLISSSFFWFPAIYELKYTVFSDVKISEWQNYFASFSLMSPANIVLLVCSGIMIFSRINEKLKAYAIFFILVELISIYFAGSLSKPLWSILPISFIQFPFRMLSLQVLAGAFLSAFVVSSLINKKHKIIFSFMVIFAFLASSIPFISGISYIDKGEGFYSTNEDSTTVRNEYMPRWVKVLPLSRPEKKISLSSGILKEGQMTPGKMEFSVDTKNGSDVTVNTIYYPGWIAYIDGRPAKILNENPKGLIEFNVPEGKHDVVVKFGETPLRLVFDLVSMLGLIIIFVLFGKRHKDS